MTKIKVFKYIPEYDAFETTKLFQSINGKLGLREWTPVVWITRLLCMDNDYGEHVFDNWDEREKIEDKHNIKDASHLLIVCPNRFQDGKDGPCNTDKLRKLFWTDVFKSLELDIETIFEKARDENKMWKKELDDDIKENIFPSFAGKRYIENLEEIISSIKDELTEH